MKDESNDDLRARILRSAAELFGRYGFQAVGVDRIVEESGVAKMTLYRTFSSKDDLIIEYLGQEDARVRSWIRRITAHIDDPKEKLRAFYEALADRTANEACRGCPFQIAASEFPDPHHPAHVLALTHKRGIHDELESWVRALGLIDAESLTNQLVLLMEGSWAAARMRHAEKPGRNVARAATMLIEGAIYAQAVAASSPGFSTNRD